MDCWRNALRFGAPPVLLFSVVVFTACGTPKLVIQQPAQQSSIPCGGLVPNCQVDVVAQWTGAILSAPSLSLDGTSVANALNSQGTGTITAAPGRHTIVVAATVVINNGTSNVSDSKTFTINPPFIFAPSGGLSLQDGSTGTFTLSTTAPLSAPQSVTLKSDNGAVAKLGTGSTATTTHVVTIPASMTATPASVTDTVSAVGTGKSQIFASASGFPTGQAPLTVDVTLAPSDAALFLSDAGGLQSVAFNMVNNTWSRVDNSAGGACNGDFSCSLGFTGSGQLFLPGLAGVKTYNINPDLTFGSVISFSDPIGQWGISGAASGTSGVRANASGFETYFLSGPAGIYLFGAKNGQLSEPAIGVDVAGTTAVRVTVSGIEVYDLSTLSSPTPSGSNNNSGHSSQNALDVKIFAGGSRAIRATDGGIETYDITKPNVPLLGSASGGSSSGKVAIAVNSTGTLAVRAYSGGIETYSVAPSRIGQFTNVASSSWSIGACLKGSDAFRATDGLIEAFDITNPSMIRKISSFNTVGHPGGVFLACR